MRILGLVVRSEVLGMIAYALWVTTIFAFSWATIPYLIDPGSYVPPAWLSTVARALFYRDYVF